ncbi:hypothetical protein ACWCQK_11275 [Streptomyces sp. NPDC002306]
MSEEEGLSTLGGSDAVVHTRAERELAVSHWLVCAADDLRAAQEQWEDQGVALLRCGGLFSAVRIPAAIVFAAAGTDDRDGVDAFLADALHGGPVFVDTISGCYYCLVPASAQRWWTSVDAACLGRESYLGVPNPCLDASSAGARSYWCVPMDGPGDLCVAATVHKLVLLGRHRRIRGDVIQGVAWNGLPAGGETADDD